MNSYEIWGLVLIIVTLVTVFLLIRRFRAGRITTLHLVAGLIARAGFLLLGIVYVTEIIDRNRRAPIYGLAVVGAGIALNLLANVIENIRRARHTAEPGP